MSLTTLARTLGTRLGRVVVVVTSGGIGVTVHYARVLALAVVLVGISALILSPSVCAQQPVSQLPLDELRALAEQGDAGAQFTLGLRCQFGLGVPEDNAEFVRWFRLAADQGHAGAQVNLWVLYANGEGVPLDDAESVRWYRLAADQGHAGAQHYLGLFYGNGAA